MDVTMIIFNKGIRRGLRCYPKIPHVCQQWANFIVSFYQDFRASMHSDFFQGQMDRGLIYGPYHSEETCLSCQKEEEEDSETLYLMGLRLN